MDRHVLRRWMAAVALAAVAALALGTSPARADVGDLYVDACLNAGAAQAPCGAAPGQTGAYREALSPDGRQLYEVVSGGTVPGGGATEEPAVLIYDRNPATG